MRNIDPGHTYEVYGLETPRSQTIRFIHKEPKEPGSVEMVTIQDGTTNEEILKVLIDRMQWLQARMPCRENAITITKLEEALMWQDKRRTDREARKVLGKHTP